MHILLDKGASVHGVITIWDEYNIRLPPQPLDTILSQAVSRPSYKLSKRLVDEGANVRAREEHLTMALAVLPLVEHGLAPGTSLRFTTVASIGM
jgi:hypothetical protein